MRAIGRAALLGAIAGALHGAACGRMAYGQTHPNTVVATIPAGTWYFALRAFNAAGLESGYSNVVQVACAPAPPALTCDVSLAWDRNDESDLAGYRLMWGLASGVYTAQRTLPVDLSTGGGTQLPAPKLRIRP
jgi:hypothetical protein